MVINIYIMSNGMKIIDAYLINLNIKDNIFFPSSEISNTPMEIITSSNITHNIYLFYQLFPA